MVTPTPFLLVAEAVTTWRSVYWNLEMREAFKQAGFTPSRLRLQAVQRIYSSSLWTSRHRLSKMDSCMSGFYYSILPSMYSGHQAYANCWSKAAKTPILHILLVCLWYYIRVIFLLVRSILPSLPFVPSHLYLHCKLESRFTCVKGRVLSYILFNVEM